MGFVEAVKTGLNNCFSPYGRSSRSEFWWYALFIYIIGGVIGWFGGYTIFRNGVEQTWLGIIFEVIDLLFLASLFCASIRRLHDTGKSGLNVLWYFLPLIGWIIEVILLCGASQKGENKYGPEPR